MVKSQITLMEGEVLNNENKRNAFLWLQSYIEQLGVRTKKTGCNAQGHTAFSSPASANANTCSPPTGILVLHRKPAQLRASQGLVMEVRGWSRDLW
ncbi:PREDICTED: uncharacterized protein LOC107357370 isoform X3 [Acropora digitifera]|uniref:uncharacterized protein LOC107357370 isoform X3 n=1 Tax=Acropora digitifera TaxID=70779 RepID=UPI00077AAB81|nr:PREDICTED: uncharacterized protein LOC107357370 isoform X3 [Acropora digitifera]